MTRFKQIGLTICATLMLVVPGMSHATWSITTSGPSSVLVGESASFVAHIKYVPTDLAPLYISGGGGFADGIFGVLSRGTAYAELAIGTEFAYSHFVFWNFGLFDADESYEVDATLSTAFNTLGTYSVQFNLTGMDEIIRTPTPLCFSMFPDCNPGAISDGYTVYSGAVIYRQVAVVPEPETYAMLLAGLGLLGFAARRRKLEEEEAAVA